MTRPTSKSHDFVYGRPVHPSEFLNRKGELRTVFNRLRNGESTAIVGEPHAGKTSLLLKLADKETQKRYLGDDARCFVVSFLDLQPINSTYTPTTFWEKALEALRKHPGHPSVAQHLTATARVEYAQQHLEQLFNLVNVQGRRLLLLLDEFERLLIHPNFQDPAFFALLRSLSTLTGGLALILASRFTLAELNRRGHGLLPVSSPFFNFCVEVRLDNFDEQTVGMLFDKAGEVLSTQDRQFARRVAGRHPFLLQAMIATLIDTQGQDHLVPCAEVFYNKISSHFDDLWRTLDDRTRTTLVILSTVELGKRALGQRFACGEIENITALGHELKSLSAHELAEQVGKNKRFQSDQRNLLLWQGQRWTVGAQAVAWWVYDVAIAETRKVPAYDEWLSKKGYRLLLTQAQWEWLVGTLRTAPELVGRGIGPLARALLNEVVGKVTDQPIASQPMVFSSPESSPSSPTSPSITAPKVRLGNILIVTAAKTETQAVLEVFSQVAGEKWTRQVIRNKTYYNLGTHGGVPVFMVQSEMGIATPGGALLTVHQAIQDLQPQAIIMCGIAFGLRPDKQQLGDILVAKQLQYYEHQKVDLKRGQMPRGDRTTCAERLLDRFRSGDIDWQGTKTHFGLIVAGEKLINDPAFRDWLLEIEPEAIGGEMEGAGLYVAARDAKVDWILVKAICDWGDGNKNDAAQPLAARNAAQFVLHVLQLGGWGEAE